MLTDSKTQCNTAKHASFKQLATVLVCLVGPGVPILYAVLIRLLRRNASRRDAGAARKHIARFTWRGLGDPFTRVTWGAHRVFAIYVLP